MNVRAAFVTNSQSPILMQPGYGAFDDPADLAQAASVRVTSPCQSRLNAQRDERIAMRLRVVGAVAINCFGAMARSSRFAFDRRNLRDKSVQLGHIVTIGRGRMSRQGRAISVGQNVVFRAGFSAIRRVRAGFLPPKTARMLDESTTARDQSILSAPFSRSSKTRWTFSQTPAAVQSRKRRQQLMPEPQPSSCGRCSQPMPVRRTKRIPVNAFRASSGLRPGYRARRGFAGGRSGSIRAQSPSSKIGFAILAPPCAAENSRFLESD